MQDDKMTIQGLLLDIGFSDTDAETYWHFLNLETVSVRKVAERSGINRSTTYLAIKRLVAAGLVAAQSGVNANTIAPKAPKRFTTLFVTAAKICGCSSMPKKSSPKCWPAKIPKGRPLVKYYEDDEGVVAILRDKPACSPARYPKILQFSRPIRQYIYRKFPSLPSGRLSEGPVKVIAVGEGGDPVANSERKWLQEPTDAGISSYTIIYGDKVATISISNDFTPYGVVVEDAGRAAMQRLLFERLWETI